MGGHFPFENIDLKIFVSGIFSRALWLSLIFYRHVTFEECGRILGTRAFIIYFHKFFFFSIAPFTRFLITWRWCPSAPTKLVKSSAIPF